MSKTTTEQEVGPIGGAALVGAWMGLGWAPLIGMIAGFVVGATSSPATVGQGIVVGSIVGALVGPVVGALVGGAAARDRTAERRAGGVLREA